MSDPLDFGVDLASIVDRVTAMGYFLRVERIQDAAKAIALVCTNELDVLVPIIC